MGSIFFFPIYCWNRGGRRPLSFISAKANCPVHPQAYSERRKCIDQKPEWSAIYVTRTEWTYLNCSKVSNSTRLLKKKIYNTNCMFLLSWWKTILFYWFLSGPFMRSVRYIDKVNILHFPKWKSIWKKWAYFLVCCGQLHWVEKFKIRCLFYFIPAVGEKSL